MRQGNPIRGRSYGSESPRNDSGEGLWRSDPKGRRGWTRRTRGEVALVWKSNILKKGEGGAKLDKMAPLDQIGLVAYGFIEVDEPFKIFLL